MNRAVLCLAAFSLAFSAWSASAAERDFCAARPGQATPPCTLEPGRIMAEVGVADWIHEHDAAENADTVLLGEALVRAGLSQRAEIQLGWTPLGFVNRRDNANGNRSHHRSSGDLILAVQRGLGQINGPAAVRLFVTVPTGSGALAAGDWGGGAMLPLSFNLSDRLEVDLTPEIDAAVNASGSGRHIAYGSVAGFGLDLHHHLSLAVDAALFRDRDPAGATSRANASTSLAWMAGRNIQLDVGVVAGLNGATPDREAYFGFARRF